VNKGLFREHTLRKLALKEPDIQFTYTLKQTPTFSSVIYVTTISDVIVSIVKLQTEILQLDEYYVKYTTYISVIRIGLCLIAHVLSAIQFSDDTVTCSNTLHNL
jgi:hypothetical protein